MSPAGWFAFAVSLASAVYILFNIFSWLASRL